MGRCVQAGAGMHVEEKCKTVCVVCRLRGKGVDLCYFKQRGHFLFTVSASSWQIADMRIGAQENCKLWAVARAGG